MAAFEKGDRVCVDGKMGKVKEVFSSGPVNVKFDDGTWAHRDADVVTAVEEASN